MQGQHPAQHIVMIRPEIRNNDDDIYFIQIAKAFQDFGHRVTIITCHRPSTLQQDLKNIYVIETSTWIPKNVDGRLKYPLYLMKSLVVILKYILLRLRPQPSVVLCNASCLTLPFLYFMKGKTKIQLQNPKELNENSILKWLQKHALKYTDEIILPDNISKSNLEHFGHLETIKCSVLYPCVNNISTEIYSKFELQSLLPKFPRNGFLFCCFGDYFVQSNFELALAGFCISLKMVEASQRYKMHLVIAGNYNPNNQHQKEYLSKIKKLVYLKMFSKNITLLQNLSNSQKKCLMFEARAVIVPTLEAYFSGTILEAMCLGKTVIATNCSFASEVLTHQITGYLVAPNPTDFAEILEKLVNNKILPVYIGNLAETEFRYKYSFIQFSKCVNQIVSKHCLKYIF